jgi:hypothetical protein
MPAFRQLPSLAAEGSIMFRSCFALLLFTGLVTPAAAVSPDPNPKSLAIPAGELSKARELVQQLGSEQFTEREEAELELAKMGRLARPALVEGASTDPSQEVRSRCCSLLPKATALDIRARLDAFLADSDGKYEHDLPGWNQFRSTIRGDWTLFGYTLWSDQSQDKAARKVFADLIASSSINRQIILAVGGGQHDLGQIVIARRQELYNMKFPRAIIAGGRVVRSAGVRQDPTTEDIAALLFAESHVQSRFAPRTSSISSLITSSGFAGEVQNPNDKGKVYRAIAVAWLDSRLDPMEMYQAMILAGNLHMPEQQLQLAIRLITTPGAPSGYRAQAMTYIAHLGNKGHIPLLEKALDDTTLLITIRKPIAGKPVNEWETHDVQVRDAALAVSITLAGQNIEDYGFVETNGVKGGSYTYSRYYLSDDDQRNAALAKWKKWRESEGSKK